MPTDKSLFYYGSLYHMLFDPALTEGRQVAADLVADGSAVLDIACGTGVFSSLLRARKNCRVIGIDLSLRMVEFARKSNPYSDVTFRHADATDLSGFADFSFDYGTVLQLMHELPRAQQARVLQQALRVARKVIVVDWASPLPGNVAGMAARVVEATFGHDHNRNFKAFLASGGLAGILKESASPITLEHHNLFSHGSHEVVVARA